jgi:uncharacterized membrane protein
MKYTSAGFLKLIILLFGIVVLAGMIRFPQTEGRAANLNLISIYTDPFIIYIYIGSIPFFVGLYQVFKLLNLIEAGKTLSQGAVNTLTNIKIASFSLIGFIILALIYIHFSHDIKDDPAGPTALGILVSFAAALIALGAALFEKLLQKRLPKRKK